MSDKEIPDRQEQRPPRVNLASCLMIGYCGLLPDPEYLQPCPAAAG